MQCEDLIKQRQIELQKGQEIIQNNEKIIQQLQNSLVLVEYYLKQVQQFSQSLTFSTTYKHNHFSVTQNGKLIETSTHVWQCYMYDQMIPKNGVIQFAVQIIQINAIMIGIGFRDIVQSNAIKIAILLEEEWEHIAFTFSTNDIIIVEVDIEKKYVKWTKQSTNESFTLTIDTSKDLYPCVHLCGPSKVEILNQLFK
ncbi:unnamed protein product [Paramecium octaurelia]|uniref:Uncharacterized protein n=1 Tax=Paramecium octaurelia TaxID=43137 RepID=A0A8S1XMW6_PAROT|nr:unnamed protein product [Paramecium octaurelia]